jgi:two-component sensor histidine kinase
MSSSNEPRQGAPREQRGLVETPQLADALESDRFKRFLDHIPFAVVVAELHPSEHITYANVEFERLTGQSPADIEGGDWDCLRHCVSAGDDGALLSKAVTAGEDYIGVFRLEKEESRLFDAWSNLIHDDSGAPMFRLVALADVPGHHAIDIAQQLHEKDTLLRELQHRVKNNLQMITALIRMEARNVPAHAAGERFDRLAGRVGALALLYGALSAENADEGVDLGTYLSQIASAVMQAHASEGVRLDMKVDAWPVSINVAMPAGLVVNELLTNSLKHAFVGREGGTITLHSLVDDTGCRVLVADDGVGLPEGSTWPQHGKLGMLIVQSLRSNAGATIEVKSSLNSGVSVSIFFARANAAPVDEANAHLGFRPERRG